MGRDPVIDLLASVSHIRVLQLLASVRPHLSAAEQAIATYIVENPRPVAGMSAAQLAEAAGVSEATVFRLCRDLGYPGYAQLREEVAAAAQHYAPSFTEPVDLGSSGGRSVYARSGEALEPAGSPYSVKPDDGAGSTVFEPAIYNAIRVLVDAVAVSPEDVERAAEAMVTSRRVILTGVGGYTARIAEMAAFGLQRLGLTCMVWVDTDLRHVAPQLLTPEDAVLGISYSGNNRYVMKLVEMAREAGATTVSITNYKLSPVAKQSHIALVTSFREATIQNFDLLPRLSQLVVVQMLMDAVRERVRLSDQEGSQTAP